MGRFVVTFNLDRTFSRNIKIAPNKARKIQSSKEKRSSQPFNPNPTAIYLWVSDGKNRFKVKTDMYVKPIFWDSVNKKVMKNGPGHSEYNSKLNKLENLVYTEILRRENTSKSLTWDDVKKLVIDLVKEKTSVAPSVDFFQLLTEYIQERKPMIKDGTVKKLNSFKSTMEEFQKEEGYKLDLFKINRDFDLAYRNYCIKKMRTDNTLSKDYDMLRQFMYWSKSLGHHEETYFENLKVRRNNPTKPALTLEEFHSILTIDLQDNPRLDRVRDIFCFQAFTGQRVSDIKDLKWKDLSISSNRVFEYWILKQVKGRKWNSIEIPILPEANKILHKYRPEKYIPENPVFPVISGQKLNDYLKEVCKLAGINAPYKIPRYCGPEVKLEEGPKYNFISTHMARRTFVTLSLKFGMAPEAIMRITGHTKYEVLKGYLDLDKEYQKENLFNNWEGKFDKKF